MTRLIFKLLFVFGLLGTAAATVLGDEQTLTFGFYYQ